MRLVAVAGVWGGLTACDSLTGTTSREEALVQVTPLGGATEVSLITSTSFLVAQGAIDLVAADTQLVSVPSDDVFRLTDENRFYVSVGPGVEGDTATVRMEVWIDGEPWFSDSRTLGADSIGYMTFVYRLNQPAF